jgi:hypothetical protein
MVKIIVVCFIVYLFNVKRISSKMFICQKFEFAVASC